MSDDTREHEHIYSVVLCGNLGSDDQPWIATCGECGHTERENDAPHQLGIMSWSGEPSLEDSEDVTPRAP